MQPRQNPAENLHEHHKGRKSGKPHKTTTRHCQLNHTRDINDITIVVVVWTINWPTVDNARSIPKLNIAHTYAGRLNRNRDRNKSTLSARNNQRNQQQSKLCSCARLLLEQTADNDEPTTKNDSIPTQTINSQR